jgi:small-conductance mechanosensitive channel
VTVLAAAALALAGVSIALRRPLDSLVARLGLRRVYRVGDRVAIGDVEGEVTAIGPLRTKLRDDAGGIVSIANRTALEVPVRTFAGAVREELTIGIPYRGDWERAEQIVLEEARSVSREDATRTYVALCDDWLELTAQFAVAPGEARQTRDALSRAVRRRFDEEGIHIASRTVEVKVGDPLDAARPTNLP